MLKERDQSGCDGNNLLRRNVHKLDIGGLTYDGITVVTALYVLRDDLSVLVKIGICLSDHILTFIDSGQICELFLSYAVTHIAIRSLEEAVIIATGKHRQGVNQADVRTFRGLNRAQATVVSGMHVTYLKACTLTSQATGTQGRNSALMGDLGQRIVLIHELGQLGRAVELSDGRADGLSVDKLLRSGVIKIA